ncbi:carbohydrate ABC transporter permease, partial [Paenibacillus sp. TAF58]
MKRKKRRFRGKTFYFFVFPWLIGSIVFTLYPILSSLYFSFTEYDINHPPKWIGLGNYVKMLHDELFWCGVKATLIFTLFSVPLQLVLSLVLALLVNQKLPFQRFFRTVFYFPSMISGVALSLMWLWVFNSKTGIFNYLLSLVGVAGPGWLEDEK